MLKRSCPLLPVFLPLCPSLFLPLSLSLFIMISLSLFLSLVAAGLIGGFVTPALTGRAELRSQRFGNYPLTQQPTTAQMHSHTLSPSFSLSLTHRHTHIHTWPACQYVRDGETGCLCFPSRSLSPPSHLSPSLISWVRFRGEEGVKLRRLLTFHSNIQSILSHPGPELTHPCTCTHTHTHKHTHTRMDRNPGRSEGLLFLYSK